MAVAEEVDVVPAAVAAVMMAVDETFTAAVDLAWTLGGRALTGDPGTRTIVIDRQSSLDEEADDARDRRTRNRESAERERGGRQVRSAEERRREMVGERKRERREGTRTHWGGQSYSSTCGRCCSMASTGSAGVVSMVLPYLSAAEGLSRVLVDCLFKVELLAT